MRAELMVYPTAKSTVIWNRSCCRTMNLDARRVREPSLVVRRKLIPHPVSKSDALPRMDWKPVYWLIPSTVPPATRQSKLIVQYSAGR